jgi:hypothetical protein
MPNIPYVNPIDTFLSEAERRLRRHVSAERFFTWLGRGFCFLVR